MILETTIKRPFKLKGIGVHSGRKCEIEVSPAMAGEGITFIDDRNDTSKAVPARWEFIENSILASTIKNDCGEVATVEHLMAAFYAHGIDNATITVRGGEIPIMDGSSSAFVEGLRMSGIRKQGRAKSFIKIEKEIRVEEGDRFMVIRPHAGFLFKYTMAVPGSDAIDIVDIELTKKIFDESVGKARTFGNIEKLHEIQKQGKAIGASMANTIALKGGMVMNSGGLRFEREMALHKDNDMIGDVAMSGKTVIGAVEGYKSGHDLNLKALKALMSDSDNYSMVQAYYNNDFFEAPITSDGCVGIKTEESISSRDAYVSCEEDLRKFKEFSG